MRTPEQQQLALECLTLAHSTVPLGGERAIQQVVVRAESYLAFVLGTDTDDVKAKLAVVRQAVS